MNGKRVDAPGLAQFLGKARVHLAMPGDRHQTFEGLRDNNNFEVGLAPLRDSVHERLVNYLQVRWLE